MRYLASVAYDGNLFSGWQIQKDARSVEGEIEKVLTHIFNNEIKIFASGRTDAKVHARKQTFHFDIDKDIDLDKTKYSINCLLPSDIHLLSLEHVSDDFHARFNVISKTYRYIVYIDEYDPFKRFYVNQIRQTLDIAKIKQAKNIFIGTHNFQNYTSKEDDENNFIRTINYFNVEEKDKMLIFEINGNGFMRYMVRIIVGALLEIGLNKIDVSLLEKALNDNRRDVLPYRASPEGLYLIDVYYK